MTKVRTLTLLCVLCTVFLAACSSTPDIESDLGMDDAPDWVNEGTRFLRDDEGRVFHGVGSAQAMGDQSLQISTADNRARAEIARILSSYVNVVFRDYSASAAANGEQLSQQDVNQQIENITRVNVTGATIIAHWRNPDNNVIYALAELDMNHVNATLEDVKRMNAGLAEFMSRQGDNIFDRVATETTQ